MPANSPIPLPPQVSPRLQRMFDERRTLEQALADTGRGILFDDAPREEER